MRRFFALVLSMLLASLGIMAGAAPASAHHNTVSGTAVCEADGTYSVTWQFRNSEAIEEYAWVSSSTPDGSAIVKDTGANPWEVTQTAWPQGPAPTASQSNVAAGATVTFRQTGIPATATRADVTINGVWTNGKTRTVGPNDNSTYYAGVQLPAGGCGQDITVKPATICGHDTDNTEWHFVITQTTEAQAPASIQVTWVGGPTSTVPLDKVTGGTAHYRTTANLNKDLQTATARILGAWTGQFNVSHGPACGSEVNNPKYTVDQKCGSISVAFTNKDIPAGPTDTKVKAVFTVKVDSDAPETIEVPAGGSATWSKSFAEDSGSHKVVVTPQGGSATTYTVETDCVVPAVPTAIIESRCVATGGAQGTVTLTNGATPQAGQSSAPVTFTVKVAGRADEQVEVAAGKSTIVVFGFPEGTGTRTVSVSADGMTPVSKEVTVDCFVPAAPQASISAACVAEGGATGTVSLTNAAVTTGDQTGAPVTFTVAVEGQATQQVVVAAGTSGTVEFDLP